MLVGAETLYTLDKVETQQGIVSSIDIDYFIKKSLKIKYLYFILRDLHKTVIKQWLFLCVNIVCRRETCFYVFHHILSLCYLYGLQ